MAVSNKDISNKHIAAESREIVNHFGRSSHTYKGAARLQTDVANELLELAVQNKKSNEKFERILDLGCGPGLMTAQLSEQTQQLVSLDLCASMLSQNTNADNRVLANSHQLPFQSESFDLVFSSLMIQWCDLQQVLSQIHQILKPNGKAVISTLVTGSLTELQQAWTQVDNDKHIHEYLTTDEVKSVINTFDWQQSNTRIQTKTYPFKSVRALAKELKHLGANIVQGRQSKGLMPKSKWLTMESTYREMFATPNQQIPASYQVMYLELTK